jgi:hypothetical protein
MGRIILAMKPDNFSEIIINESIKLARSMNDPITVVSIIEEKLPLGVPGIGIVLINDWKEKEKYLRSSLSSISNYYNMVDINVMIGSPRKDILEIAANEKASFIVIGTHGYTGLGRYLSDGIAAFIIRHSCIPVLVIPLKQHAH